MIFSPSDELAWTQITEGSNQVSQSKILSISISHGCRFWWNAHLKKSVCDPAMPLWRVNDT